MRASAIARAATTVGASSACSPWIAGRFAIAPGTFKSPSWEERVEELGKEWGGKEKALEMFVQRQPMGRVADAAEIAPIVVYLASDEAAFTTGTVMSVDGGFAL